MTSSSDDLRDLLATAFDCFPMAVVIIGLDGRFLHANPSVCRLLGHSADELRRHHITDFFPPEQRGAVTDLAEAILDRGLKDYREERTFVRRDGSRFRLDVTGAVLRSAGGKPRAVLALGREVPAADSPSATIPTLDMDLFPGDAAAGDGAAIREEFDAFCRTASQQFRVPLRIIEGYADIVVEDCADAIDEVALRYMNTIRDQSRRLARLIDSTVSLARITSRPLQRENLDLSAVALDAAAVVRAESHAHEVAVRVEPGLHVDADANLVGRLLRRLFDNAFRFSRASSDPCVEFGRDGSRNDDTFYVRDNGSGFDAELADRLFLPFETLHQGSEAAGSGVGLAEVKRIVTRHGGRVWAEGAPGGGATFYFTLPPAGAPPAPASNA